MDGVHPYRTTMPTITFDLDAAMIKLELDLKEAVRERRW